MERFGLWLTALLVTGNEGLCAQTESPATVQLAADLPNAGVSAGESKQESGAQQLIAQKVRLVEMLLERAGKQPDGKYPDTGAEQEEIRMLLGRARTASQDNEMDAATESVNAALQIASRLARIMKQEPDLAAQKAAYRERLTGVLAFRQAFSDVVAEKGEQAAAVLDIATVDLAIEKAERLASGSDYREAAATLQTVYDQLSSALVRVRANETLRHRLVFETPRDEFDYERERYRSHRLLVDMAILERNPGPEARKHIDDDVHRSRAYAREAVKHAAAGDYEAAIQNQETATAHLIDALQRAGIFLPR